MGLCSDCKIAFGDDGRREERGGEQEREKGKGRVYSRGCEGENSPRDIFVHLPMVTGDLCFKKKKEKTSDLCFIIRCQRPKQIFFIK